VLLHVRAGRAWAVGEYYVKSKQKSQSPLPEKLKWAFLLKGWFTDMVTKALQKSIINDSIIKDLSEQVLNLKYGSIVIKVHDSKIVQVEVTERTRYEDVWLVEKGGGI